MQSCVKCRNIEIASASAKYSKLCVSQLDYLLHGTTPGREPPPPALTLQLRSPYVPLNVIKPHQICAVFLSSFPSYAILGWRPSFILFTCPAHFIASLTFPSDILYDFCTLSSPLRLYILLRSTLVTPAVHLIQLLHTPAVCCYFFRFIRLLFQAVQVWRCHTLTFPLCVFGSACRS